MSKKIIAVLLVSIFMLSGCQSKKNTASGSNAGTAKASTAVTGSALADKSNSGSTGSKVSSDDKTTHSNSGASPELNSSQKAQVKNKLQPVIDNVNSTLKSIEDPKDVNLNSLN